LVVAATASQVSAKLRIISQYPHNPNKPNHLLGFLVSDHNPL
jgi:hypothetical protein